MSQPRQLWKTTIEIWSDYDPQRLEIDELAREAMRGDAYCDRQECEVVSIKERFPDTDFFDDGDIDDIQVWLVCCHGPHGELVPLRRGDGTTEGPIEVYERFQDALHESERLNKHTDGGYCTAKAEISYDEGLLSYDGETGTEDYVFTN